MKRELETLKKKMSVIKAEKERIKIPLGVFMYHEDGLWNVRELYGQLDKTGKVAPGTVYTEEFSISNPDDYKVPDGYEGTILIDDMDLYADW